MSQNTNTSPNKYSPALRQQILDLVLNQGVSGADCARQFNVNLKTVYSWLHAHRHKNLDPNSNYTSNSRSELLTIARLRRENSELTQMVGRMTVLLDRIKKKRLTFLSSKERLELARLYLKYYPKSSKKLLMQALNLKTRSSLYYRKLLDYKDQVLADKLQKVLSAKRYSFYGSKRLSYHFKEFEGQTINHKRIARIKIKYNIACRYRRKRFKRDKGLPEAIIPNLIKEITPTRPNHIWSKDFTYLNFHGTWLYLATIKDNYTKEIMASKLGFHHNQELVLSAFATAVLGFKAPEMGHSDGGSEYRSYNYQQLLQDLGVQQSMSKKSSPWENGCKESFYSYFKLEIGNVNQFQTFQELEQEIKNYIEFYNKYRICGVIKTAPSLFRSRYYNTNLNNQIVLVEKENSLKT